MKDDRIEKLLVHVNHVYATFMKNFYRPEHAGFADNLLRIRHMAESLSSSRYEPNGEYSGDVEYHVETQAGETYIYETLETASAAAFNAALVRGSADVDVVIFTEKGALSYGGDDAVEQYREDPDASVFERYELRVNNLGRVR